MLNNKQQNLSCKFTEALVSYLYDELPGTERSIFERHLVDCSVCSDEMASFGLVRNSITDWYRKDFASLANPMIEIPFADTVQTAETTPVSRPWSVIIRDFFTLSPTWMTATTAFAALAICLGLGFILINSRETGFGEIVQQDKVKPVPSPTMENKNSGSKVSETNQNESNIDQSPSPELPNVKQSAPPVTNVPAKQTIKPNLSKNQNQKRSDAGTVENKSTKSTPKSNSKQKMPSLIGDDDDDDDSLRLSDLLDEIGKR